ncbi:MAG TPA: arsenosugar biosynthesis radical SAM (seleno)protein ArsS [Rhodothermales bacterium]|nr:arsenosugar biosynthesis radical SAM (seleno)protein ArsS [Rhodothermales bacterium]
MADLDVLDGPRAATSLRARHARLDSPEEQQALLQRLRLTGGPSATGNFDTDLAISGWSVLQPAALDVFQVNVGKLCNMTCRHCHVDAGPDRTDANMDRATAEVCIAALAVSGAKVLDLTGGAPELNPHFEYLVREARALGVHVMDRCNLTILTVPRTRHLPAFLAEHGVEVVCSLPHYRKLGTDAQRGSGTYERSLQALRLLNEVGYGQGTDLVLMLVTNPVGAFLAGNQASLEQEWKDALWRDHGVRFDRLLALHNMPISRYLEWLEEKGQTEAYLERLLAAFNPATIAGLMCRTTLSVGWDGRLFDCDFNQQLDLEMTFEDGRPMTIFDFEVGRWQAHRIRTGRHCFGCTAGAGSGCGGSIA